MPNCIMKTAHAERRKAEPSVLHAFWAFLTDGNIMLIFINQLEKQML